jgi:DUF1009 family protein
MPGPGFRLGQKISSQQQEDLQFGFEIARQTARMEIGQTVVVKEGVVLAVEAFEGTDKCIQRGGELAGKKGGAVVVKVARLNHDMRFDIPCIGSRTVETCLDAGVSVLGIEAGKTILLEREEVMALLAARKFSIATLP